jgi:putative nucleotidyltransferase with HDIG domain
MRSAIEAIRNEVFEYLQKEELQSIRLRRAVRAAIARSELRAENRRLVAGLQETTRKLKVLSDVSQRLSAESHLDRLLPELAGAARELLEAESARVLITEHNELGDLTIRAAFGDGDAAVGGHFGPGDGIAGHVLDSGKPVRLDDPADHPNYSARCDDLGGTLPGFLCVPLERPTLSGVLTVAGRTRPFSEEDLALLASLARQGAVAIENASAAELNRNFFTHACELLVGLLDADGSGYEGHSHAVAALTDMMTRRLRMPEEERRTLHFAALLHDVGKLRMPEGLLSSGRPLTASQLQAVRQHPALGVEILRPISIWRALAPAIHSHHERWDGTGYPRGLAGAEIPIGGRIIAVAEAFEAMLRALPQRPGRSVDEALAEVRACAGTQFDPAMAQLFIEEYQANRERFASLGARGTK